ncbi:MAG: BACON domain-containing protein [Bacteroides xylanisolvens]
MRKILTDTILQLIGVVCILSLSSCQELNIDSQAEFPIKLETDAQPQYNVLATSPRTVIFNVSSNTPWKVTSDKEWCTPTPAMSSTSSLIAEISLNILNNPNEEPRTATLTIIGDDYKPSTIIKVTQDAKSKLSVQWIDEKIPSGESSVQFKITSNKTWTASSSSMWLTLDKESGEGSTEPISVTATAKANPGKERSATVTISNGLEEQIYEVIQKGYILEFAELEEMENPYEFTGNGTGTGIQSQNIKTYKINANIDWKVSTEAPWIELIKAEDNTTFTATVRNEYYFDTRTATISLEATDKSFGLKPIEIIVNQKGGDVVYTGTDHAVDANGHLTLNTTNKVTSRFNLKGNKRKLAIYEWKFSNVDFTDTRAIDLNLDGTPAAHMWMGPNTNFDANSYKFQIGNTLYPLIKNKLTKDIINKMHTLRVEMIHKEGSQHEIIYKVILNNEEVMESIVMINPYLGSNGYMLYFGFHQSSTGTASMTINSFEVIPVE